VYFLYEILTPQSSPFLQVFAPPGLLPELQWGSINRLLNCLSLFLFSSHQQHGGQLYLSTALLFIIVRRHSSVRLFHHTLRHYGESSRKDDYPTFVGNEALSGLYKTHIGFATPKILSFAIDLGHDVEECWQFLWDALNKFAEKCPKSPKNRYWKCRTV